MKQQPPPNDRSGEQRRLGRKGLIAFITLLAAFIPLSTDLYLPALPTMSKSFGAPEYQVNLTLTLFFVFYAIAMLVWGPISDRHGRRPVLILGLSCYTIAGALCAVAPSVFFLIGFRVVQAVGAGAATVVANAIVKDVYRGRKREATLSLVQSMTVISPMVAPMLGALLLTITSWRGTFVAQGILGAMALVGSIVFVETIQVRTIGGVAASFRRLGVVAKHRTFATLLLTFGLMSVGGLAYIASSSYIYQDTFGTSSQVYSLFFAIYAIGLAVGPFIYMRLSTAFKRTSIITGCFGVNALSGVLILLVGGRGPWLFTLAQLPFALSISCIRPPATYLLLDQHEHDAGSASALMGSSHMILGSIGMVIVSLQLGDRVQMIGLLYAGLGLLCGALWLGVVMPLLRRNKEQSSSGGSHVAPTAQIEDGN